MLLNVIFFYQCWRQLGYDDLKIHFLNYSVYIKLTYYPFVIVELQYNKPLICKHVGGKNLGKINLDFFLQCFSNFWEVLIQITQNICMV
jgi:hypothetical protein